MINIFRIQLYFTLNTYIEFKNKSHFFKFCFTLLMKNNFKKKILENIISKILHDRIFF